MIALLLAGVFATVVSCASNTPSSTPSATTVVPGSGSTPGSAGTAEGAAPCAWATKADKRTLNVAYPDTAATYWTTSYVLAPGERLELRGRFPDARYASFITYGPRGGAIDVLTDRDIEPDPGAINPFQGRGGPAGGRYTISVRSDTEETANSLSADPTAATTTTTSSTASSTTAVSTTSTAGDTAAPGTAPGTVPDPNATPRLGTGTPGAPGVIAGTLIYRIYLARSADPTGGGGLPDIRVVAPDGAGTDVPTCPAPGANPAAEALVNANGPPTNTPAPAQPIFLRPAQGAATLYPNPDNVYVVTILRHAPGQIVVVRGKAPTFPDTADGAPVTGREQVRYWSLCTDEYRKPYPVSSCVADQDVALDQDGMYTFVISTPAERPANATAANGITWLDWGSTSVDNLLLLRHMLAAPDFTSSAINLAPGSLASTTMGPYTPVGTYCATEAFASGGPGACP